MKINIDSEALAKTKHEAFGKPRKRTEDRYGRNESIEVDIAGVPDEALEELMAVCDKSTQNSLKAILKARDGECNIKIPNFRAALAIVYTYLAESPIKGWIFHQDHDGHYYPYLVRDIRISTPRKEETPKLEILGIASAPHERQGTERRVFSFEPSDLTRRTPADALAASGLFRETDELHKSYQEAEAHFDKDVCDQVGKEFVMNGILLKEDRYGRGKREPFENRRVVNDLNHHPIVSTDTCCLFNSDNRNEEKGGDDDQSIVPHHHTTKVFDLKQHEYFWTHTNNLNAYKYKPELVEKLILPESHRDILDILTHNLEMFVDDIIEGKSAGNVILCKGSFGVGKTLTAEIYSEVVGRPLYSVHAGVLGTNAHDIEKELAVVFEQVLRWDAVLLIDEADVFVARRGDNIEQNAVVAVFLRTLEYFKGLLFMTTNRADDIDEAIQSRCAAIISYPAHPEGSQRGDVWKIMAANHKVTIPEEQLGKLVETYPDASPRDIKMLLRLALRVANQRKEKFPSMETFRQSAVFRGMTPQDQPSTKS